MVVGTAEALAGELGLAAFAEGAQRYASCFELLGCNTAGVCLGTGMELTKLMLEVGVEDQVIPGRHRGAGGSLSLSRFQPNSAARSSAET